ncbi:MAG: hypothetical protein ACYDAK_03695 [Candidatus Limnocylindrales bacterium]
MKRSRAVAKVDRALEVARADVARRTRQLGKASTLVADLESRRSALSAPPPTPASGAASGGGAPKATSAKARAKATTPKATTAKATPAKATPAKTKAKATAAKATPAKATATGAPVRRRAAAPKPSVRGTARPRSRRAPRTDRPSGGPAGG